MNYITCIYYQLDGKEYCTNYIVQVDNSLPNYLQCQEAVRLGTELMNKYLPKNAKNVRFRTFEPGIRSFNND